MIAILLWPGDALPKAPGALGAPRTSESLPRVSVRGDALAARKENCYIQLHIALAHSRRLEPR